MKKTRKFSMLLMTLAMIATLFAGCGSKDNASEGNTGTAPDGQSSTAASDDDPFKEHLDISVAFWDIDQVAEKWDKDPIFQDLMKKFNITIKPVNVTWDDYVQKFQMWAASGQLPDIFATDAIGTQYYRNWVNQGIVKALPEDMSKYPSLAEYFETPDIKGLSEDGKYYNIPRRMFPTVDWSVLDRVVMYRWDLAQKAGITKEPETWDEFKAMLQAIVDKDPEGKHITGLTSSTTKMIGGFFWLYGNSAATSDGSGSDFKWIKEDGKFVPAVFSSKALPALQNMRDMFEHKLVDPDIALTKPDTAYDKFVSGKSAALLAGGGFLGIDQNIYEKRWKTAYPNADFTQSVKVLKPLTGPDGERYHPVFKTYWSESYFNAKIDDKKLDRILRLYDYILSPEGNDRLTYGVKDVDYKVEGDKKVPIGDVSLNEKYPAKGFLMNLVTYNTSNAYDMNNPTIANKTIRQEAVDYIDWSIKNSKVPDYDIRLTYMSTPTKDKFSVLDHDDLLNMMLSKDPIDKAWENTLNNYKAKGLDKMIDEVNAKAKEQGIE
ncbi:extracellular solute-binding protein [Paenibacillus sp. HJL G12]|uniref:Extracellular solute-binding protein n=1 Tax=Paenibacillus dendrobii TaxID=2691084 RepID=A0A7X3LL49_9BACL|nr:extracellular solute-binding protein [Paenibacillus dendrobii]MWV47258.1 extracellular solute-binding protein [Paenibacillus dendrobii]